MKALVNCVLAVANLFFVFHAFAQSISLVPHGEWGAGEYESAVEINGLYYVQHRGLSFLEIIDPTKQGNDAIVGKAKISDDSTYGLSAVTKYNGYLVVIESTKLKIYSVENISEPALEYTVNLSDHYNSNADTLIVSDKIYVTVEKKIFVVSESDSEFSIEKVINTAEEVNVQYGKIAESQEHLFYVGQSYNMDESRFDTLIELYDKKNFELVERFTHVPTRAGYISDIAAIDSQRLVAVYDGSLVTLSLIDGEVSLIDNFFDYDFHSDTVVYERNKIWSVSSTNDFYSFAIDLDNNVSLHSKLTVNPNDNSDYGLSINDLKIMNDSLLVVSNHFGLSKVLLNSEDTFLTIKHLPSFGGSRGRGVTINNKFYVSSEHSAEINSLELIEKENILYHSSQKVSESVSNIDVYKDYYFFSGASYTSFYESDSEGSFSQLSRTSISYGNVKSLTDSYSYNFTWENGGRVLKRYSSEPYGFYESGFIAGSSNNVLCPRDMTIYQDKIMVLDTTCSGKQAIHVFKDISGDFFSWDKEIDVDGEDFYKILTVGEFLYIFQNNKIEVASLDENNDLVSIKTFETAHFGYVGGSLILDNLLILSGSDELMLINIDEPESPQVVSRVEVPSSTDSQLSVYNEMLVRSGGFRGFVSFYQINKAPSFSSNNFTIDEDNEQLLTEHISDPEGDSYDISIISEPLNGVISGENNSIYTPNQDFYGEDKFTVKVQDMHGNFIEQDVTVSILPVNDVPVIGTTELTAIEDTELVELLDITDAEGDQLSYAIDEQPKHGVASLNSQEELTYTPEADYFGNDSVTIATTDIHGATATRVIAIFVESVNDLPEIGVDTFEGVEDSAIKGQLTATDIEGQELSFSVVADSVVNGQVSMQTDGQFVFTPAENFFGQASFIAQVTDSEQGVSQQTILIDVEGVDDIPVAETFTVSVNHNNAVSDILIESDVDGDSLEYTLITDVANGTLSLSTDGNYSYTPNNGYSGSDSFTYEVSDGKNSSQGTITLSVQAAPVADTKQTSNNDGGSGGGSMAYMLLMLCLGLFRISRQRGCLS